MSHSERKEKLKKHPERYFAQVDKSRAGRRWFYPLTKAWKRITHRLERHGGRHRGVEADEEEL